MFDRNSSPDMEDKGIERLSIDMESLSVDGVSQLWDVPVSYTHLTLPTKA